MSQGSNSGSQAPFLVEASESALRKYIWFMNNLPAIQSCYRAVHEVQSGGRAMTEGTVVSIGNDLYLKLWRGQEGWLVFKHSTSLRLVIINAKILSWWASSEKISDLVKCMGLRTLLRDFPKQGS